MEQKRLIKFPISTGEYSSFVTNILSLAQQKASSYTCVANVHMLIEAHSDPHFATVVNNADIVTPDGKPLTWAMKLFHNVKQDRVAGMDLLPDLLQQAAEKKLPVYFYGGSEAMINQTKEFIDTNYPELITAGFYSPPFRELTPQEDDAIVDNINQSGAKLVFVVLGCPKQEKWMSKMKGRIHAVMIGIGGALPVLIGMQKRAPIWMQKGGLEWMFRLGQEPRRLFKRYAVTNSLFIYLTLKEYVRIKIVKKLSPI